MDLYRLLPGYWAQNYPTDDCWDAALNIALDKFGITAIDYLTVSVGPFEVWGSNYPYAFGYDRADGLQRLPRVKTRMRLRRMLLEQRRQLYIAMLDIPNDG